MLINTKSGKVKIIDTFIIIAVIVLLPAISIARFAGGSGTEQDPYQIETRDQLQAMAVSANLDRHFIHIADIDASDTGNWNESKGFEPIGTSGDNFCSACFGGSFDGNGIHHQRPDD